jgi:hypothetical protein
MKLSRRFRVTERLLAIAVALCATYAFFYEYLPPFKQIHLYSDIEGYHYPLQRYAFHALKSGHFPQWDPSIYCGISFAGNVQAALFYPLNWVMYAAMWRHPRLPFKALEVFAFVHIAAGAALCYLWLRGRRLHVLPSLFGAAVFGYGGYMVSQVVHLGVLTGMAWMPLGLWGVDEAVDRGDWRPLWKTALASALCFLAGYPPSWIVFCATTFFYALASRGRWRAVAGVCVAVAASTVLAAMQMIPALEARSQMLYGEKYAGGIRHWSALLPFVVPNWFDYNRGSTLPNPGDAIYVYLGLAGVFAIGWALYTRKLRPYGQALFTGIACLMLAANPGYLVYKMMVRVPVLVRMVQSYNFYEGVSAMASLITAISLQDFLERKPARSLPRWLMPALVIVLGAWSIRLLRLARGGGTFPSGGPAAAQTLVALALFSIGLWALRAESRRRRAVLAAALLLTAAIDYQAFGTNRLFNTVDGDVDKTEDKQGIRGMNRLAYEALYRNRDYRIAADEQGAPNPTDLRRWGLATAQGFDPFLPAQYHDAIERWVKFKNNREFPMDFWNESMLQSLGIRYVISHEGVANDARLRKDPTFRLIGPDDSYYRVYEYRNAKPPFGWEDGTGSVRPVEWMPERRVFDARSDASGRFFLIEQFYPGWRAIVDGRSAPIERWNGAFQAIRVAPGVHRVIFEYHERRLALGAAMSLMGLVGLLWVVLSDRKRRGPSEGFWVDVRVGVDVGLAIKTSTERASGAVVRSWTAGE